MSGAKNDTNTNCHWCYYSFNCCGGIKSKVKKGDMQIMIDVGSLCEIKK